MRLDLGISIIGDETPKLPKMKDPTRREIAKKIETFNLDDEFKFELLQKLAGYPDGALLNFRDNLGNMISNIRTRRSKERNEKNS